MVLLANEIFSVIDYRKRFEEMKNLVAAKANVAGGVKALKFGEEIWRWTRICFAEVLKLGYCSLIFLFLVASFTLRACLRFAASSSESFKRNESASIVMISA